MDEMAPLTPAPEMVDPDAPASDAATSDAPTDGAETPAPATSDSTEGQQDDGQAAAPITVGDKQYTPDEFAAYVENIKAMERAAHERNAKVAETQANPLYKKFTELAEALDRDPSLRDRLEQYHGVATNQPVYPTDREAELAARLEAIEQQFAEADRKQAELTVEEKWSAFVKAHPEYADEAKAEAFQAEMMAAIPDTPVNRASGKALDFDYYWFSKYGKAAEEQRLAEAREAGRREAEAAFTEGKDVTRADVSPAPAREMVWKPDNNSSVDPLLQATEAALRDGAEI